MNKKKIITISIISVVALSVFIAVWRNQPHKNDEPLTTPAPTCTIQSGIEYSPQVETDSVTEKKTTQSPETTASIKPSVLPKATEDNEKTPQSITEKVPPTASPTSIQSSEKKQTYATLSINCSKIFDNMEKLNADIKDIIPPDGVILAATRVEINEGESVFDLLKRETKKNKIHMEYTPGISAYIEGIANIYEFDCGNESGWVYRVNGEAKEVGCSDTFLKDADRVEWIYTCDLGRDI